MDSLNRIGGTVCYTIKVRMTWVKELVFGYLVEAFWTGQEVNTFMPTNIEPYNEEGQPHGHWVGYFSNGQLDFKGEYVNGIEHGPWEIYWEDGRLFFIGTLDMGERVGLWTIAHQRIFYT